MSSFKSVDALTIVFSFLPEVQSLRMQNLNKQFYEKVLERLHFTCHVEYRQNRRAVRVTQDTIVIEGHEDVELPDLKLTSCTLLNHFEIYFSHMSMIWKEPEETKQ